MEQETTFEYNSLSCFLQLENLDTDNKQTTPKDSIFRDVSVLKLYYDILRNVEKDPFKYWNIYALRNYLWYFMSFLNLCIAQYAILYQTH